MRIAVVLAGLVVGLAACGTPREPVSVMGFSEAELRRLSTDELCRLSTAGPNAAPAGLTPERLAIVEDELAARRIGCAPLPFILEGRRAPFQP